MRPRLIIYVVLIVIAAVLFVWFGLGLSAKSSKIAESEAREFVEDITYVRDSRTGLCFAVLTRRKIMWIVPNGLGLACVPCERVPADLLKK